MIFLDKTLNFFANRVKKFGAPYLVFAIFGSINYPAAYFFRIYIQNLPETESFFLRGIATLLCFGLLLKNYWPKKIKKFLPLYWYATVTMSLPVIMIYLLLKNNFSLEWLINFSVGLLITILILDWAMSLLAIIIGTIIGYTIFFLQYGFVNFHVNSENVHLAIYLYVIIFIICVIFSRGKDKFNISVSDKLQKKILDKTNQLKRSLIIKERFLNSVSHEIKGPTQVICILTNELLARWKQHSDQKKSNIVVQISDNTKRLFDLVNNWMDTASLSQTNQLKFDIDSNNLLESLNVAIKSIRTLAKKKGIRISFMKEHVIDTKEYNAIFNKGRIEQVINNICMNAIKYSKKGDEIIIDVFKDAQEEDGKKINGFCVSIEDMGTGIAKKELETIFHSFVQGSKSKYGIGGLGLGLSLAKEIIIRHNGKIWAKNNKERGSTFYFFIPSNSKENSLPKIKNKHNKIKKEKLKILFLDDEEMCCVTGKLVLEDLGHHVTTFTESDDFFKYLENNFSKLDLIFLDIMMPVSGIDVIKEIKSKKLYKNIPIIAQSGIISDSELNQLFSFKNIGFISKPYNKELMKEEINRIFDVHNK
jgi:signal transduction histidine kinase/CheY-like chemotaxis protein